MNRILIWIRSEFRLITFLCIAIFVPVLICCPAANSNDVSYQLAAEFGFLSRFMTFFWMSFFLWLACVFVFQFLRLRLVRILVIVLSIVAVVPNIIVIGFFLIDDYIMHSTDFWVVYNASADEVKGLLSQYLDFKVVSIVSIYTAVYFYSAVAFLKHSVRSTDKPVWVNLLAMAVLVCLPLSRQIRMKVPFVDFYRSWARCIVQNRKTIRYIDRHRGADYDVLSLLPADSARTFVMIIGESLNRNHMSLYGYQRNTNPKLSTVENLFLFDDAIAVSTVTSDVMPYLVSFGDTSLDGDDPNLIELFRSAGYKTFWIENNESFGIARGAQQLCDEVVILEDSTDEPVLPVFKSYLENEAHDKFIVIHLVGSHFAYQDRYPAPFSHFRHDSVPVCSPIADQLSDREKDIVDYYDNSVLYNDYVIYMIIDCLKGCSGYAYMFYFSDHGDEVYDSVKYSGRSFDKLSNGMVEIPMMIWSNDSFLRIKDLSKIDTHIPVSNKDVIHMVSDLSGIWYHLFDSTYSAVSDAFKPKERKVGSYHYPGLSLE